MTAAEKRRITKALSTFEVTIEREIRVTNTVEVQAADEDDAETLAKIEVDKPAWSRHWMDDSIIDERILSVKLMK